MYLSRLCLNPLHAPAIRLAADRELVHRKLLAALPCRRLPKQPQASQPKTADVLFRIETTDQGPQILVVSAEPPAWDLLELAPRSLRCPPETKPYEPRLAVGQRLAFRLQARPAVKRRLEDGASKRRDCRTDEERLEWLRRKGALHGFVVESVGLTLLSIPQIKGSRSASCGAVQFDGVLVVTDPERLAEALRVGIGQQKAFGFGLLSLAPLGD
ncbi:MAG: type I-E CRISPR-associated protein Cas6/Cse3/CasE [Fimbriimonadales bacterium]|nr:type I-E CRISPR-associated protein Cas6/Cse3/CasE [Fimbriimonadales bacterium]